MLANACRIHLAMSQTNHTSSDVYCVMVGGIIVIKWCNRIVLQECIDNNDL